jgi:secondary thiamine-phosphate synthase enzyme
MVVKSITINLNTNGNEDVLNITGQVSRVVEESDLKDGVVTVFTPSSTSGLTTIEYESGCLSHLRGLFDEIIDPNPHYAHNARWGDGNGHSHVRAALLGLSFSVPFTDSRMTLGTWQQIIFVDFDNRSRRRELVVQLMGE